MHDLSHVTAKTGAVPRNSEVRLWQMRVRTQKDAQIKPKQRLLQHKMNKIKQNMDRKQQWYKK